MVLDSFRLGQCLDDVTKVLGQPKPSLIHDDGEANYEFSSGLSVRTRANQDRVVAIQGGQTLELGSGTKIQVGDSIEQVLKSLGQPKKKVLGVDLDMAKGPYTDSQIQGATQRIVRLAYVIDSTIVRLDFLSEPRLDWISLRGYSPDAMLV